MIKVDNQVLDTVKSTVNTAVETLSTVAQNFVEKNRTKAKLNRLRMVMKSQSELMNRAYIALGKEYYAVLKNGEVTPTEKQEKLLEVIDSCKAKIARARDCYRKIIEAQNEFIYSVPETKEQVKTEDVVDITVACSNESDYSSNPFEQKAEEIKEKAGEIKEAAEDKAEDFKEAVAEKKEAAADKIEEVKDKVEKKARSVKKRVDKAIEDEFPEDELF